MVSSAQDLFKQNFDQQAQNTNESTSALPLGHGNIREFQCNIST
jgi:hypothetical protein